MPFHKHFAAMLCHFARNAVSFRKNVVLILRIYFVNSYQESCVLKQIQIVAFSWLLVLKKSLLKVSRSGKRVAVSPNLHHLKDLFALKSIMIPERATCS